MSAEYIKLPGLIDPHVHLREPGATYKEDFNTGTMAAIAGGYTSVIDMPNNPEPTISPEALQKKISLAENRVFCDIGFHYIVHCEGKTLETAILLAKLNHQKLHVAHLATKEDLEMVRDAKESGLAVTCDETLFENRKRQTSTLARNRNENY